MKLYIDATSVSEACDKLRATVVKPSDWQAGECERGKGVAGADRYLFTSPYCAFQRAMARADIREADKTNVLRSDEEWREVEERAKAARNLLGVE
jgi:hypothetical protein